MRFLFHACWILAILFTLSVIKPQGTLEFLTTSNIGQLEQIQMLGRGGISNIVWNPQGTSVAIMGPNGVWIYDAENWVAEPILLGNTHDPAWGGTFNKSGDRLITVNNGGWRIWDVTSNRLIASVTDNIRVGIVDMQISKDGTILATVGNHYTHRTVTAGIQLWDIQTGTELGYAEIPDVTLGAVSFNQDESILLLIGRNYNRVYEYEVEDLLSQNEPIPRGIRVTSNEPLDTAYTEDGHAYILYRSHLPEQQREFVLQIYPDDTSRVVTSRGGWYDITTLDFTLDKGLLAASGAMGRIEIYNIKSGDLAFSLDGHDETHRVSIDPTGRQLLSYGDDYRLMAWDLDTHVGNLVTDLHIRFGYNVEWFSADSNKLAFGTQVGNGEVQIWDVQENRIIERIPGHGGWITSVIFNSDDTLMVFGSGTGCCAILHDLHNHQDIMSFRHSANGVYRGIDDVAFTQDGSSVVTSGSDGKVRLWQLDTGAEIASFGSGGSFQFKRAGIGASGEYLVTLTDSGIQIWNVETGEEVSKKSLNYGNLAFSDDATLFVFTDYMSLNIWDANTLEPILTIEGTVFSDLAFSSDNSLLAATTYGGDLMLFDVNTGIKLFEQQVVDWQLYSVDWSADQTKIAVTGREGSIHILGVPPTDE